MLRRQFYPKIPGSKETPKQKNPSKRRRDFDEAQLRPHEQGCQPPNVWLMFSSTDKKEGQSLFGDSGFNMALTDEGKSVPYTYAAETREQRNYYFRQYPDSRATPVQSFFVVTAMHEQHVEQAAKTPLPRQKPGFGIKRR